MSDMVSAATEMVRRFVKAYVFADSETCYKEMTGLLADDAVIVGVFKDEMYLNIEDYKHHLASRGSSTPFGKAEYISDELYGEQHDDIIFLGGKFCFSAVTVENKSLSAELSLRVSACCTADEHPLIRRVHISISGDSAVDFVSRAAHQMEHELSERVRELNAAIIRVQTNLEQQLRMYKVAIDATDDLVVFMDLTEGTTEFDVEKARRLYGVDWRDGMSKDNLIEAVAAIVHPDDQAQFAHDSRILRGVGNYDRGELFTREYRLLFGGVFVWFQIIVIPVFDENHKVIKAVVHAKNINSAKLREKFLKDKSEEDGLTGLLNLRGLVERADKHLSMSRHCVMVEFDIDNFKLINDYYGHPSGDETLKHFSDILRRYFRSEDLIGRIGGDEFVVFMTGVRQRPSLMNSVNGIFDEFRQYIGERGLSSSVSVSAGAVYYLGGEKTTYQDLFKLADAAMYRAKDAGKDHFVID